MFNPRGRGDLAGSRKKEKTLQGRKIVSGVRSRPWCTFFRRRKDAERHKRKSSPESNIEEKKKGGPEEGGRMGTSIRA